jgi:succinylglutamic semialdehyde dehydrogenase
MGPLISARAAALAKAGAEALGGERIRSLGRSTA